MGMVDFFFFLRKRYGGFDLRFTWICYLCCCDSFFSRKHNFFFN